MKVRFEPPWHIKDKEYLAKRKKFLLRLITRWNKLERPGCFILRAKPTNRKFAFIWYSFTYSKPPHKQIVHLSIYHNRGHRVTEQVFEVMQ